MQQRGELKEVSSTFEQDIPTHELSLALTEVGMFISQESSVNHKFDFFKSNAAIENVGIGLSGVGVNLLTNANPYVKAATSIAAIASAFHNSTRDNRGRTKLYLPIIITR